MKDCPKVGRVFAAAVGSLYTRDGSGNGEDMEFQNLFQTLETRSAICVSVQGFPAM